MKTNVSIELSDVQLNQLAQVITGKPTARKATRKEIKAYVCQNLAGLLAEYRPTDLDLKETNRPQAARSSLYQIDPEDMPVLRNRSPAYVRGWNLVKRGGKS